MTIDSELRTEALTGPWVAVLSDMYGDVIDIDDLRSAFYAESIGEARVSIVRRSAAPTGPGPDGERRLPGSYNGDDLLHEWDGFEEYGEIEARWVQAEAMAAGLNAAVA